MINIDKNKENNIKKPLEQQFDKLTDTFSRFIEYQASSAVFILFASTAALILIHSDFRSYYLFLSQLEIGFLLHDFEFRKTLYFWVNDGLMAVFFFLIGLEIKREFMVGRLKALNQSSTIIMASIGGMLFPALIYLSINAGGEGQHGWGIPMATDTTLALGALALMGSRVPINLKYFLVALAIVDDIGAIIKITFFYTEILDIQMLWLGVALAAALFTFNFLGIRRATPYALVSIVLWYVTMKSGIHASIAGVIAALATPARPHQHPHKTAETLHKAADHMQTINRNNAEGEILANSEKDSVLEDVEQQARQTRTPLRRWENSFENLVGLFVIPLFAFLNAGILFSSTTLNNIQTSNVAWGIIIGLVIGKPLGIVIMTWLNLRLGWGELPKGIRIRHLVGIGLLAGMGFTMSIFFATLSFPDNYLLTESKVSIMLATLIAGVGGIVWLWVLSNHQIAKSNS